MSIRIFIIAFFILIFSISKAQTITQPFYKEVVNGYNFLLNIPDEYADSMKTMPLIIFLHGRSLSGTDLNRVKKYGVLDAINRTKINPHAFVVAPQCPKSESWEPDKILNVLNWVKSNYKIDSNRIYVVGMSLGGYGTFDFAGKYPNEISAAIALCGGGKEKYAANLATVPLWIMHGIADRAVPVSQSQKMEKAILNSSEKNFMRTDYFNTLDHGDMVHVFYMPDMYKWLYQFDKSDSNKTKINNYDITLSDFRKRPIDGAYGAYGKQLSQEEDTLSPKTSVSVIEKKLTSATDNEPKKQKVHIVQQGDTLWAISKKNNTTIERLCQANNITESTKLQIGQKLIIK
jgi:hypothetical protein